MFHAVVIVTVIMAMIMICAVVSQVELNHRSHREKLPYKNRILIMSRPKPMAPMIKTNFDFSTSACSDALDWGPTDGFSEHGSLRNSAPTSCKHNIARIKNARGRGTQKQFYRCQSDNDKVYPWLSQLSGKK